MANPSLWANFEDLQAANQGWANKQTDALAADQGEREKVFELAMKKYQDEYRGNVMGGGNGGVASYTDAYRAMRRAQEAAQSLQTDEGRRAHLSAKAPGSIGYGAQYLGAGMAPMQARANQMAEQFGAQDQQFRQRTQADYGHEQQQMQAQNQRNSIAGKERSDRLREIEQLREQMQYQMGQRNYLGNKSARDQEEWDKQKTGPLDWMSSASIDYKNMKVKNAELERNKQHGLATSNYEAAKKKYQALSGDTKYSGW